MPLRTLLSIVLFFGFACVGRAVNAAAADSPPTADEVEQYIAITLPGYWKVDQLSLSDPVDYGNPIDPEWRWRYEALIAPKEPLYVDGGHHEGVVLLELNFSPESPQTLYGVAIATFQAGTWSGEARHENRPFDHGGQPASFFSGRTVVAGSPEERELREATQRGVLEELEAKHKAERAVVKIQHQAALATAKDAHRRALERLKVEHDAERGRRKAEHQNELAVQLAALEADLKAEAERRRVESTESEKLTELTAEARDRLTALQAAEAEMLAAAIDRLTALQAAEAERFAAASDRLTALQAEEAEMLAASERFHEARRVELKKLFDRLGVVTGPDDYLALLDTASESELDWMRVAVLRHGLESDDLASSRAAWRHLLQADMNSNPELRSLLADYVAHLKDNPDVLADYVANLKDSPDLLKILASQLPTVHQWASRAVDDSSSYDANHSPKWALGEPSRFECAGGGRHHWTPEHPDDGMHFMRVAFAKSVLFPQIEIHVDSQGGFVRKLILSDGAGNDTEYEVPGRRQSEDLPRRLSVSNARARRARERGSGGHRHRTPEGWLGAHQCDCTHWFSLGVDLSRSLV